MVRLAACCIPSPSEVEHAIASASLANACGRVIGVGLQECRDIAIAGEDGFGFGSIDFDGCKEG